MKKVIAILLGGVMVFLSSCHSFIDISTQPEYELYQAKKYVHVLGVITPDDSLYFSEWMPAQMTENEVRGIRQVKFPDLHADSVFYKPIKYNKTIIDYAYKGGIKYRVKQDKSILFAYDSTATLNIPYSQISSLRLKTYKHGQTLLLVGGLAGSLIGITIGSLLSGDWYIMY